MKDYYAILGVTPQAEDIVIKAAYRVLAQRYHPDRCVGSISEASSKMASINEAYGVLSDQSKRMAYDAEFHSAGMDEVDFEAGDVAADEGTKQLNEDWETALDYYPDLLTLEANLAKSSKSLAFTFRLYMIVHKDFKNRTQVAQFMQNVFINKYFGEKRAIVDFAKTLIAIGRKDAAKALNEAVRVLGDDIDPTYVIQRIMGRFELPENVRPTASNKYYIRPAIRPADAIDISDPSGAIENKVVAACQPNAAEKYIIDAIEGLGGEVSKRLFGGYTVIFRQIRHLFESPEQLAFWFFQEVLPKLYFVR